MALWKAQGKRVRMEHSTIAIDIAMSVFQVAVWSRRGSMETERRLSRNRLLTYFAQQPAAKVGVGSRAIFTDTLEFRARVLVARAARGGYRRAVLSMETALHVPVAHRPFSDLRRQIALAVSYKSAPSRRDPFSHRTTRHLSGQRQGLFYAD